MDLYQRKKLFNLLCRDCSPEFIEDLRAYESLPGRIHESFEVSFELVNGLRMDSMRIAIMCLYRKRVLEWISLRYRRTPWDKNLLLNNSIDACFGIGMADYSSGWSMPRIKVYHDYDCGRYISHAARISHVRELFSIQGIQDIDFLKDLRGLKRVHASCVDRDSTGKQNVKVYFGPFHIEDLFDRLGCFLSKDEALSYKTLDKKNILPKIFYFCVKYCAEMRTIRTDMCYKTKVIVPYLKALDRKEQIIRALKDMYKIFPEISLQYIGMQLAPVEKLQFYFLLGEIR